MKHRTLPFVFAAAVSAFVASAFVVASAQDASAPAAAQAAPSPEDQVGLALLNRMCNRCHDSARIVEKRRTKEDWQEVLLKMIERGATGESSEFETLWKYLRRNHGQIYINDAPVEDIAMTLGLSAKDAEAIATFRESHGAFADFDAVKKVPDIDLKALEAHKDAVAF